MTWIYGTTKWYTKAPPFSFHNSEDSSPILKQSKDLREVLFL